MGKKLELTPRLRVVADMVPTMARLADVGTDHGYLPAALILEGKIQQAIAADLRQGPLSRAKETVKEYELQGNIQFRLCDGLQGIRAEEVDAVAIAGMGGETISMILQAAPWIRENNTTLILQPMSSMLELRVWLEENGYQIQEERLAREGDTIYTVFLVCAGESTSLSLAERWVGRNNKDVLRYDWLEHWENRIERAKAGMQCSRQENLQSQIAELEDVLTEIQEMKKEWVLWQQ